MPIYAYVGTPGAGKSHECVKSVIVPAFLSGRRVVTNIDGLDPQAIHDYCLKQTKGDESSFGSIEVVTDSEVIAEGFFPHKLDDGGYTGEGFVKPGDLVCLDEVWRFWGSDKNLNTGHRDFISEHRHFEHPETGISCDIVLMNQALDTMARFVKSRIETTFRMSKLNALGLSKRYRVDIYSGVKLFKSYKTSTSYSKYDKDIFTLYKSTSGGQGNAATVDSRQNIFSHAKVWVLIFGLICMFGLSFFFIAKFFSKGSSSHSSSTSNSVSPSMDKPSVSGVGGSPAQVKEVVPASDLSKDWRISGTLFQHGSNFVILVSTSGSFRVVSKTNFHGSGYSLFGIVDGQRVTYYSGSK